MKPTKNQFYCFDCGRPKMLFESKKKADNFIRFNKEAFEEEGKKVPVRSYYCEACGGWHVTSNPHEELFFHEPSEKRLLTKMERVVAFRMGKSDYNTFIVRKDELIEEAKALYLSCDYRNCIEKCREVLQILKDNGKEWWNDNRLVKRMMYEVICREAVSIQKYIKKNDFHTAEDVIALCCGVMEELEEADGFDEYRTVLNQCLRQSSSSLKARQIEYLHGRTKSIERKISETWGYLMQKKYTKVRIEIDRYTAELITLSKMNDDKEILRPVVNKLFDLSEAYKGILMAVA